MSLAATATEPSAELDALLQRMHQSLDVPAISAAVVLDGELVYSGGAGLADLENDVPATGKTVYRIASISKPIAAVAVMQLVQQGHLTLDEPIHKFVPEFPEKEQGPITIWHLLTHTSGIRHYRDQEFFETRRFDDLPTAIAIFKDDPLEFAPGEKFQYSSYAFNLLAGIIETDTGMPFEEYLQLHVWQPAGMESTYFDRGETLIPHRAGCYVRGSEPGTFLNGPYVDLSIKWAGGGMLSSAEDLARFHLALNAGKLLSDSAQAEMTKTQFEVTDSRGIGLSWFLETDADGVQWVSHSGGGVGATTHLLRCPEQNEAVVLLTNISGGKSLAGPARRLLNTAREAYFTAKTAAPE